MAAFRPVTPLSVFIGNDGAPLAGGFLKFYDTLTTTAKSVYSDAALGTNLGNVVTLDSAGRAPSDLWGSGVYRVRLYDADDVLIDEADPVQEEGASGSAIPSQSGNSGEFLTTNGTVMSWSAVRQVPDPTGQANKVLSTDGTNLTWIAKPADGAPGVSDIAQDSTSFAVADMRVATGTGTGTNLGGRTQSATVTFGTAFTTAPLFVGIQVTNTSLSSGTNMPSWAIPTVSTTGFTVNFTMGEIDDSQSQYNFNAAVTFKYVAIGVKV